MASPSKFGSFEAAMARNSLEKEMSTLRKKFTALDSTLTCALERPMVSEYEIAIFRKSYQDTQNKLESLLVENPTDSSLAALKVELKKLHSRLEDLRVLNLTPFQQMGAKVHSLCSIAAQSARDLVTILETSKDDRLSLSRAFESGHRKLSLLQKMEHRLLFSDEETDALTETQRRELLGDLARHMQVLSRALTRLVRAVSQEPDGPLIHFQVASTDEGTIECAICGDEIGRLCERCDYIFNHHVELVSLNAHGIAHSAQVVEVLKADLDEAFSKSSSELASADQIRLEWESLSSSIENLKKEEIERSRRIEEAKDRIAKLRASIEMTKKQNSLIKNRIDVRKHEIAEVIPQVEEIQSKIMKQRRKRGVKLLKMCNLCDDPFDPKLFSLFGMKLPKNLQTLIGNASEESTYAVSLLVPLTIALAKLYQVELPQQINFAWANSIVLPKVFDNTDEKANPRRKTSLFAKALGILPGQIPKSLPIETTISVPLLEAIEQNVRFIVAQILPELPEQHLLEMSVGSLLLRVKSLEASEMDASLSSSTLYEDDVDFVFLEEEKESH